MVLVASSAGVQVVIVHLITEPSGRVPVVGHVAAHSFLLESRYMIAATNMVRVGRIREAMANRRRRETNDVRGNAGETAGTNSTLVLALDEAREFFAIQRAVVVDVELVDDGLQLFSLERPAVLVAEVLEVLLGHSFILAVDGRDLIISLVDVEAGARVQLLGELL